jgi:hypothetical protein
MRWSVDVQGPRAGARDGGDLVGRGLSPQRLHVLPRVERVGEFQSIRGRVRVAVLHLLMYYLLYAALPLLPVLLN